MRQIFILAAILIFLGLTPAYALDSLGVTDTLLSAGVVPANGAHFGDTTAAYGIFTTNSTETNLVDAFIYGWEVSDTALAVLSIYNFDSNPANMTLQAQSDTILIKGTTHQWFTAPISGELSPNTDYVFFLTIDAMAANAVRINALAATWNDVLRLTGQTLEAPANLSGHSTHNEFRFAGFVTLEAGISDSQPPDLHDSLDALYWVAVNSDIVKIYAGQVDSSDYDTTIIRYGSSMPTGVEDGNLLWTGGILEDNTSDYSLAADSGWVFFKIFAGDELDNWNVGVGDSLFMPGAQGDSGIKQNGLYQFILNENRRW